MAVVAASEMCRGILTCGALSNPNRQARLPERPAGAPVEVSLKIAGIHWWYRTRAHAAELTAGYYNTANRDGYNSMVEICAEYGAALTLTCVEMCDAQHPPEALCGPEGLLRQVRSPDHLMFECGTSVVYILLW